MKFRVFRSGLFFALICGSACIAPAQTNRFVSNDLCKTCHSAIWNAFYKNPHFKSIASGKEPPESTGCQGCHGPAGNHIDNGGGKDTIRAFSVLPAEQVLDTCLRCHGQTLSRANIRTSQHTLNGMACTSCHSIHRAQSVHALLRKPQTALCEECHTDVRAQFAMPFKHRVEEGVIACTDCHNPHGSFAPTWAMCRSRPRHSRASHGERGALSQVPCRQTRAFRLRASGRSCGWMRDLSCPPRFAQFSAAPASGGVYFVPGVSQRRRELRAARKWYPYPDPGP